jgi:hypothetical protein
MEKLLDATVFFLSLLRSSREISMPFSAQMSCFERRSGLLHVWYISGFWLSGVYGYFLSGFHSLVGWGLRGIDVLRILAMSTSYSTAIPDS